MKEQKIKTTSDKSNSATSQTSFLVAGMLVVGMVLYPAAVLAHENKVEKQIEKLLESRKKKQAQSRSLAGQAKKLKLSITDLRDEIAIIQSKIDENNASRKKLQLKIDEAQKRLDAQRRLLSANIRAMYMEGEISPLVMVASSSNLSDFMDKQEYRDRLRKEITGLMNEIDVLRLQLQKQQHEINKILEEQNILKDLHEEKRKQAQQELSKTTKTKADFDAEIKRQTKLIKVLNAQRMAAHKALATVDLSKLKSLKKVKKGEVIGKVGNTGYSFGAHLHFEVVDSGVTVDPMDYLGKRGWLLRPTSGPVTQGYGEDHGFAYGTHFAVDFGANSGTKIKAVAPGKLYTGCTSEILGSGRGKTGESYGYMAIIDHGNGLRTLYAHMQVPKGKDLPCDVNLSYL